MADYRRLCYRSHLVDWRQRLSALPPGSGVAGATSSYDSSNADGFDVDTVSFAIPSLTLPAGTYYLTLSAAVSAGANPVYWDINDGASVDAWDSADGHVSASNTCFQTIGISGTCASSFEILSASTTLTACHPPLLPEPDGEHGQCRARRHHH